MPITVVSKILCKKGKESEMVLALKAMQSAVAENEPGTEFFLIHKSRKEFLTYYIVEQYANEAAGDEHGKSSSFQRGVKMLQTAAAGPAEHIGMDLIE